MSRPRKSAPPAPAAAPAMPRIHAPGSPEALASEGTFRHAAAQAKQAGHDALKKPEVGQSHLGEYFTREELLLSLTNGGLQMLESELESFLEKDIFQKVQIPIGVEITLTMLDAAPADGAARNRARGVQAPQANSNAAPGAAPAVAIPEAAAAPEAQAYHVDGKTRNQARGIHK